MTMNRTVAVSLALLLAAGSAACDEKKEGAGASASASASASAAPVATTPPPEPSAKPADPEPAPAASSDTSMITGDAKDVVLTVKDPKKEQEKTIKAAAGGSVTVFLPDYPGTVWSIESSDKALGKAKEEVIPGFAPGTNGHQFKWTTTGAAFKAGHKHKVQFVNKKAGDKAAKATESFTLTIEIA
ncbi:MAG: hypothetical protein KF764_00565 [Labilithrix sp.]|nr:hypothetical protein [Labilithrix sp.]MBX3219151.1 hypothetical protein [Labilithrix sp.]